MKQDPPKPNSVIAPLRHPVAKTFSNLGSTRFPSSCARRPAHDTTTFCTRELHRRLWSCKSYCRYVSFSFRDTHDFPRLGLSLSSVSLQELIRRLQCAVLRSNKYSRTSSFQDGTPFFHYDGTVCPFYLSASFPLRCLLLLKPRRAEPAIL